MTEARPTNAETVVTHSRLRAWCLVTLRGYRVTGRTAQPRCGRFGRVSYRRLLRNRAFRIEPSCMLWSGRPQHTGSCVATG